MYLRSRFSSPTANISVQDSGWDLPEQTVAQAIPLFVTPAVNLPNGTIIANRSLPTRKISPLLSESALATGATSPSVGMLLTGAMKPI